MKLVKLLVVVGVSVILQIGAVRYAEAQRGYDAIGGEILVFPSALFAGYKMLFPDEYLLYEEKEGGRCLKLQRSQNRSARRWS